MKFYKIPLLVSFAIVLIAGVSSCKKITEDQLINGLWQVNKVTIDTSTSNYLNTLPHYGNSDDCCAYKLAFEKDNVVIAYYITYDSFTRYDIGTWEATAYKEVYISVDDFIDGTFKVAQPVSNIKRRILTSEDNHIKALEGTPLDTAKTVIDMLNI
ncbi:MAG TPA: hypothetical protein VK154_05920 [Chitinophagales bacterium]|nr:hypothetical protein [Chitinophagales bacterium]